MLTLLEKQILEQRKTKTQREVAKFFNVSQANISKIEKNASRKLFNACLTLNELEKDGNLLRMKFLTKPLHNALFILPYIKGDYELTGISAQFLLTNYYELTDEIEIRTELPFFRNLWGGTILRGKPGPTYLIKYGIRTAIPEKILSDCLQRNDLAGIKSSMAMLINYKMDLQDCNINRHRSMTKKYDEIIHALELVLKEYELKNLFQFHRFSEKIKCSPSLLMVARKVVDDFAPFLEEEAKKIEL